MVIGYIQEWLYVAGVASPMSFTFRQLEVFVEAAQDCNFRKTAERLGISQPSVSNQIRVLERWSGGDLFHRTRGSTPRLSAKGTALLGHARQLLAGRRELAAIESAPVRKEPLRLRIAAGPWLLDRYIRPALPRFLEKHDDLVLDFLPPGAAKHMRRAVRNDEADVAAFTAGRDARRLAGAEFICETPCSLYGNARFARLAAKGPSALASLPFVLPLEDSDLERWMLRALKRAGISPGNIAARSQFADVIADMVTSGKGVSVLFDEQMAHHVRAGRAFRLGPALESASRVLVIGPRARGRATAAFLEFLRQVLKREPRAA
jgi:DNA-binding transcriptional LysR family regulator